MKKLMILAVAVLFIACDRAQEEESASIVDDGSDSSSLFKVNPTKGKKLLSYQFEVKGMVNDVRTEVLEIERIASSYSGIILLSELHKDEIESNSVRISEDSVLNFQKIVFSNDFKIKIPIKNFNKFVLEVSSHFKDIDKRKFTTEDLSLVHFGEELKLNSEEKILNKIYKFNKIRKIESEQVFENETNINNSKLALESIKDRVEYCKLDLTIFQSPLTIKSTLYSPDVSEIRTPFNYEFKNSVLIGWHFILELLYFLIKIWPLLLLCLLILYFVKFKKTLLFIRKSKS